MVLSQVSHSDLEVKHAVPYGDESLPAEHNRGPPAGGLGELGKEDAGHHGWDDDPGDALDAHRDDGEGTAACGGSATIPLNHELTVSDLTTSNYLPDGVLSLQTEEESLGEILHIVNTHHVVGSWLRLQIT